MINQAPQLIQKELLVDVMELASLIEDEFYEVFKPYPVGWYRRMDETAFMPLYDEATKAPIKYHVKGGDEAAPWDEQITSVIDPNDAASSIFNSDGDLVYEVKGGKKTISEREHKNLFTPYPVIPVRGIEIVLEYLNWFVDRVSEYNKKDIPFYQYLKAFISEEQLKNADVLEIEPFEMNEKTTQAVRRSKKRLTISSVNDELVPTVTHGNWLVEKIQTQLELHSIELRRTLDVFIGINTWEVINIKRRGVYGILFQKLGDYRILEWTRLKKEGKI